MCVNQAGTIYPLNLECSEHAVMCYLVERDLAKAGDVLKYQVRNATVVSTKRMAMTVSVQNVFCLVFDFTSMSK